MCATGITTSLSAAMYAHGDLPVDRTRSALQRVRNVKAVVAGSCGFTPISFINFVALAAKDAVVMSSLTDRRNLGSPVRASSAFRVSCGIGAA